MKRKKILLLFGMILLITGCTDFFMICSLNPFYLEKSIILLPEIEGRWTALPLRIKHGKSGKEEEKKDSKEVWKMTDTTSVWKIQRRISKETKKTPQGKDTITYKPLDYYVVQMVGTEADSSLYQFKMVLFQVNRQTYADFMPIDYTGLGQKPDGYRKLF